MRMIQKSGWMSLIFGTALIALAAAQEPVVQAPPGDITGYWRGILKAGPQQPNLTLVLQFNKQSDGNWAGYLHRVTQDQPGIPSGVSFKDGKLKFRTASFGPTMGGTYEGTLNETGTDFQGTWTQDKSTTKLPLNLHHVATVPELIPPQEPQLPYPYSAAEVTFTNPHAGIKLAGTLTQPPGVGPFPAIILVQSPGTMESPRDRNMLSTSYSGEELWRHKPFLVLADHLTRQGFAVLRLDDRGAGGSTGTTAAATPQDLATDILEGLKYLKTRPAINSAKIGLLGYGEGAVVAPICAAQSPDVKFMVLMAPRALTGTQLLSLLTMGATQDQDWERASLRMMLEAQAEIEDIFAEAQDAKVQDAKMLEQKVRDVWTKFFTKSVTGGPFVLPDLKPGPEMDRRQAVLKKMVEEQVQQSMTAANRSYFNYDPAVTLKEVKCPVLALTGELDDSTPAKQNLHAVETALKAAGNRDYTTKTLPQINDNFKTSKAADRNTTIAPSVLTLISDWLGQHIAAAG